MSSCQVPQDMGPRWVQEAALTFWPFLQSSDCDRQRSPEAFGEDLDWYGKYFLKPANYVHTSLNLPTIASTDVPKSSEGKTGASSVMSARYYHRCLSVDTITALD